MNWELFKASRLEIMRGRMRLTGRIELCETILGQWWILAVDAVRCKTGWHRTKGPVDLLPGDYPSADWKEPEYPWELDATNPASRYFEE